MINSLYKELVHRIIEKIKNKPYFWRPNKMPLEERGHTMEDCRTFRPIGEGGAIKEFLS